VSEFSGLHFTIQLQNSEVASEISWRLVISEFRLRPNSTNKEF